MIMKVIFVCTGNTCRSPLAEGYLSSKNISGLTVCSRGIYADSSPVSENSAKTALKYGFDISAHISKPITEDDLDADFFICMSDSHKELVLQYPVESQRVFVLSGGIPDPFGGDLTVYDICANRIFDAIDNLLFEGFFTGFCVKDISFEHIKEIAKLEKECFSTPWSENAIAESVSAGTKFFVAEKGGKVAGYVGISTVLDEGYITNVAVASDYRRSSVATLLLSRIFTLARKFDLSFVSLEVRNSNIPAISLYEKNGFKQEGKRKNFYEAPLEDALIMTRRFK